MIKAKIVLRDKFWILEEEGVRVGTLSWNDEKYLFTSQSNTEFFDDRTQVKTRLGIEFPKNEDITVNISNSDDEYYVYNYPSKVFPHNVIYDVKRKLPLFAKSEKSKSLYCAGYYIINFGNGWLKSFCPKLITVERYETKGPFKTELEMKQELSRANRTTKHDTTTAVHPTSEDC